MRVLIYLSLKKPGELGTISEIAKFYGISRNHLVKVVHHLASHGLVHTIRGKHGGMHLARPANKITIGETVRLTEPNFEIAECFNKTTNHCKITPICELKSILAEARNRFLQELDRHTIADAVSRKNTVLGLVHLFPV